MVDSKNTVETPLKDLEAGLQEDSEESEDPEDCGCLRSLDFDLVFSFTIVFVVALMLCFIFYYWLNGVARYIE